MTLFDWAVEAMCVEKFGAEHWPELSTTMRREERLYHAPLLRAALAVIREERAIVPKEATEEQHHAARDWSMEKYRQGIGREASHGCYTAMLAAAPARIEGEPE